MYSGYGKISTIILTAYSNHVTHPLKYNANISGSFVPTSIVSESPLGIFIIVSVHLLPSDEIHGNTNESHGHERIVLLLCWFEFLCQKQFAEDIMMMSKMLCKSTGWQKIVSKEGKCISWIRNYSSKEEKLLPHLWWKNPAINRSPGGWFVPHGD